MIQLMKKITEAGWFQHTITGVILLAAVVVGLETYPDIVKAHYDLLHFLNQAILIIFIAEIAFKMIALFPRPLDFFKDPWNVFDFIIVAAALMPIDSQYVTVLRLARLLRVLRLVRAVPRLQVLVGALIKSIPSMGYVAILLFLMFYIYAVAATFLFGTNDPHHFRELPISFVSLFRAVTLEDWTDLMYIQMYGCANYGYVGSQVEALCTNSQPMPVVGAAFFISFVLLGTMIFLNLFVGVILAGMDEAQAEQEDEARRAHIEEGGITLADELNELNRELKEVTDKLHSIQRHVSQKQKLADAPMLKK
ncbi:MAG: ion transporter [bacterium]|nr:ion transporter [bacterium]